ncbi:hypothetical protein C1646_767695 [Rhizophagus diaphanus]|nr:hypothetical protein C1646_767695 [Rhizophagus diaphanus] [Rhizophagus sp. MUCL 43196]
MGKIENIDIDLCERTNFETLRDFNNMATRQARSARERQTVREALATLKGVQPQEIPYPRSNTRLA